MRTTPDNITCLNDDEIFVFGSNLAGIHGAGAALMAAKKFGARYGVGMGVTGQCYAIATKDGNFNTLPLSQIRKQVFVFLNHAASMPHQTFLVTQIGCGYAGYNPDHIAPMFKDHSDNVILPLSFIPFVN